eukprot:TRINITY_DN5154_c0_g1_i1.p1 TRINITY_DN5154_c0_g1~~TRINITY_DN5154_c0_g1_i1.p1  ORF type:complete len:279 (+),score=37.04 TRINITY_DN5154_c0_g1_i1:301-1137(+)
MYSNSNVVCEYCSKGFMPSDDRKSCTSDFNSANYPAHAGGRGRSYRYFMKPGKLIGFKGTAADWKKASEENSDSTPKPYAFAVMDQAADGFPVGCSNGNWYTDNSTKVCNDCHFGYYIDRDGNGSCHEISGWKDSVVLGVGLDLSKDDRILPTGDLMATSVSISVNVVAEVAVITDLGAVVGVPVSIGASDGESIGSLVHDGKGVGLGSGVTVLFRSLLPISSGALEADELSGFHEVPVTSSSSSGMSGVVGRVEVGGAGLSVVRGHETLGAVLANHI